MSVLKPDSNEVKNILALCFAQLNEPLWQARLKLSDALNELLAAKDREIEAAADVLTNACQLMDSIKMEWESDGSWSAWDQGVRDAAGKWLLARLDRAALRGETEGER